MKNSLKIDEILIQIDYNESYENTDSDEIQSA